MSAAASTILPSFVELMASLGLEKAKHSEEAPQSLAAPASPPSSHPTSPSHSRSSSTSSLHDAEKRTNITRRVARYAPYAPAISHVRRRSQSCSPEGVDSEKRTTSYPGSPRPPSPGTPGADASSTPSGRPDPDIQAYTPISTYARRKTPQPSPISFTFPRQKRTDVPMALFTTSDDPTSGADSGSPQAIAEAADEDAAMPFILPTLPMLFSRLPDVNSSPCSSPSSLAQPLPGTPEGDSSLHPFGHNNVRLPSPLGFEEHAPTQISPVA